MTITPTNLNLHRISKVIQERRSKEGTCWTTFRFFQADRDGNETCVLETIVFTSDGLPIMWEIK